MRDEDKTKEQLLGELAQLRKRVADLERTDVEFKRMEEELLSRNKECQMLTSELEGKYRTIQWHESLLTQSMEELNEKNDRCTEYNLQLRRKRITIRVLAILFVIVLVTLGWQPLSETSHNSPSTSIVTMMHPIGRWIWNEPGNRIRRKQGKDRQKTGGKKIARPADDEFGSERSPRTLAPGQGEYRKGSFPENRRLFAACRKERQLHSIGDGGIAMRIL